MSDYVVFAVWGRCLVTGSTGKPKGVLHTTGGYMVYAATTSKYVFDLHPNDVYFCTADCGAFPPSSPSCVILCVVVYLCSRIFEDAHYVLFHFMCIGVGRGK
jgi:acyl-CoA synthetase (AMP-forming)/AMP-acid ligase II